VEVYIIIIISFIIVKVSKKTFHPKENSI
jgi:hypothetical protein